MNQRLWALAALAAAGALAKTLGAVLSGSRALLVDSVTCLASLASLAGVVYYQWLSSLPPDEDHPYGHSRLRVGGLTVSLAAYMFSAGFSAAVLLYSLGGYRVEEAPAAWAAMLGGLLYAAAVSAARGLDPVTRAYAGLASSEVVESIVSGASAALGGRLGYVFDLAGAALVLLYILYEAAASHRLLLELVSDRAAPAVLYDRLRREAAMRGLRLLQARLRMLDERSCSGDALVAPPPGMPLDVADVLADELAYEMRRSGCDLVVHVAVAEARAPRLLMPQERRGGGGHGGAAGDPAREEAGQALRAGQGEAGGAGEPLGAPAPAGSP